MDFSRRKLDKLRRRNHYSNFFLPLLKYSFSFLLTLAFNQPLTFKPFSKKKLPPFKEPKKLFFVDSIKWFNFLLISYLAFCFNSNSFVAFECSRIKRKKREWGSLSVAKNHALTSIFFFFQLMGHLRNFWCKRRGFGLEFFVGLWQFGFKQRFIVGFLRVFICFLDVRVWSF